MKSLILASILMASVSANAKSALTFKTVRKCETIQKVEKSEMIIEVQKAQDGQAQLIISPEGQQSEKIKVKEILPPTTSVGGSVRYIGKDTGTDNKIILTVTLGTAPVKVGKVVGRKSSLTVENIFEDLPMVCASVQ